MTIKANVNIIPCGENTPWAIGQLGYNKMGYFIYTEQHAELDVMNVLPEYKNSKNYYVYFTIDGSISPNETYLNLRYNGRFTCRDIISDNECKKIIASSNPDDWKDGILHISKEFINQLIRVDGNISMVRVNVEKEHPLIFESDMTLNNAIKIYPVNESWEEINKKFQPENIDHSYVFAWLMDKYHPPVEK